MTDRQTVRQAGRQAGRQAETERQIESVNLEKGKEEETHSTVARYASRPHRLCVIA